MSTVKRKKGNYVGFARLKGELASKPGVRDPAALAASIGRKKMGAARFNAAAAKGRARHYPPK